MIRPMRSRLRIRAGATLTALCLALAGTAVEATPTIASTATSVSVELDWVPNPDHVSLYYAQEKGFFTKAGLSVSVEVPSDVTDPIKLVGLNKVDLAVS